MSTSNMLQEFRDDLQKSKFKPVVEIYNQWTYTFLEINGNRRVAIANPRGQFVSYEKLSNPLP